VKVLDNRGRIARIEISVGHPRAIRPMTLWVTEDARNCSSPRPGPWLALNAQLLCHARYHNVMVGSRGGWPDGNFYPGDASSIVEDFHGGKAGNYRLCRGQRGSSCKKPLLLSVKALTDGIPARM